ncbi:MAG TPA: hypothetical protein VNR61_20755 [Niallia sp.]|nr:hypothetical protein [Niallia sp.]
MKCPICDKEIKEHRNGCIICKDEHHFYKYKYIRENYEIIGGVIFHSIDSEDDKNLYNSVLKLNRDNYKQMVNV